MGPQSQKGLWAPQQGPSALRTPEKVRSDLQTRGRMLAEAETHGGDTGWECSRDAGGIPP